MRLRRREAPGTAVVCGVAGSGPSIPGAAAFERCRIQALQTPKCYEFPVVPSPSTKVNREMRMTKRRAPNKATRNETNLMHANSANAS